LNLLAALMVLLGEETEVYSYLNPLIKLLVSVLLSIHLFYVLIQILVNLSGLHPHRFHIQEKVFFARLYYEAAFENSRITVFLRESESSRRFTEPPLWPERSIVTRANIFGSPWFDRAFFIYFCFTVSFASLLFFKK